PTVVRDVQVPGGQEQALTIALSPASEEPTAPEASPARAETGGPLATPWPTVIGGSVTVVALGVGAGLGLAALGSASDLDAQCGGPSCPNRPEGNASALADLQSEGRALADASTVAFVVGAAAAVATTTFFVLWLSDDTAEGDASLAAKAGAG